MNKSKIKDIIVIVVALIAIMALVVFLLYIRKQEQQAQQQQIQQGVIQATENEIKQEQEKSQKSITIRSVKDNVLEVYNAGSTTVDLQGYEVWLNGERVFAFESAVDIEAKASHEITLASHKVENDNDILCIYQNGELIYQTIYSVIAGTEDRPFFTVPSGFYNETVEITIEAPEGAEIYYTLDGTLPTKDSLKYESPIVATIMSGSEPVYATRRGITISARYLPSSVEKATVITAMYVDAEGNESEVAYGTYFIGYDIKPSFTDIPVIAIWAQPEDLFNYKDGIYVSGKVYEDALAKGMVTDYSANYCMGWEADVYMQCFDENKHIYWSSPAGLTVENDGYAFLAQKSLYLLPQAQTGAVLLSNGKADYTIKIRSQLASGLLAEEPVNYLTYQPCAVFINGEYWGVYMQTEGEIERAIAEKTGLDQGDILVEQFQYVDAFSGKSSDFTSCYEFIATSDMTDESVYEEVQQMIDIQNYIEYICANVYIGNSNFPGYQQYVWKAEGNGAYADGKWRFLMNDVEQSMANSDLSSYSLNTFLRPMIQEDLMLYSLMRNETFRQSFAETMMRLAEEVFTAEKTEQLTQEITKKNAYPIVNSYTRFFGGYSTDAYKLQVEEIVEFFENRKEYIISYTMEFLSQKRELIDFQAVEG